MHVWRDQPIAQFTNERGGTKDDVSTENLWITTPRRKPKSSPNALAVCANRVLVAEGKNLFVYDIKTGQELQKIELPGGVPISGIAIANGQVVVSCSDGSVLGLR